MGILLKGHLLEQIFSFSSISVGMVAMCFFHGKDMDVGLWSNTIICLVIFRNITRYCLMAFFYHTLQEIELIIVVRFAFRRMFFRRSVILWLFADNYGIWISRYLSAVFSLGSYPNSHCNFYHHKCNILLWSHVVAAISEFWWIYSSVCVFFMDNHFALQLSNVHV